MVRITILFFILLTLLAVGHTVALEYFLYWEYLWLDIPMHLLGGIVVALGLASLPFVRTHLLPQYSLFVRTICGVLAVGIAWEVFEVIADISVRDVGFWGDTILDLLMDVVGGVIGYGIIRGITRR